MIYLRLLTDQHQHIFHFRLQEIREYHALVTDILRVSKSTDGEAVQRQAEARHVLDTAAPLLNLALPSYDALADTARELRESADELTRAAMDENNGCEDVRTSLADILLKQAKLRSTARARLGERPGVRPGSHGASSTFRVAIAN